LARIPITVKKVASISGVSVRTLHFYDEIGLLKPAFYGTNGYRFYEEAQLLMLQQILFYRELGLDLGQIRATIQRADFEKADALACHREVLQQQLVRMRTLLGTIDRTIAHLKGETRMEGEQMFEGFSVSTGKDRFDGNVRLNGEPHDCKVSAGDTNGAMAAFEFTGTNSGPRHLHYEQDEWLYIVRGDFHFEVGSKKCDLIPGESIFLPRGVPHAWLSVSGKPGTVINVYQPAGKMEEFVREVGKYSGGTVIHEALTLEQLSKLFRDHGMDMVGPPVSGEWRVDGSGRMIRTD